MAAARKISVKGKRVGETYQALHACWRARAVSDFRYGARSETDPTLIWTVDGAEYADKDHAGVMAAVDAAYVRAGIESAVFGEQWCGYRELVVTYTDGRVVVDGFEQFCDHDEARPIYGPAEPCPVYDFTARLASVGVMA